MPKKESSLDQLITDLQRQVAQAELTVRIQAALQEERVPVTDTVLRVGDRVGIIHKFTKKKVIIKSPSGQTANRAPHNLKKAE